MAVEGYRQFGGVHSQTAALRNVLDFMGATAPHDDKPFSEALLFGIMGGIGAAYFTFEWREGPSNLFVGVGPRYMTKPGELMERLCQRLSIETLVHNTTSARRAESRLRECLDAGRPLIVYTQLGELPYYPADPRVEGSLEHALVVIGLDEAGDAVEATVADLPPGPQTLSLDGLWEARVALSSWKGHSVEVLGQPVNLDLRRAVEAGIRDACEQMLRPERGNFGLQALERWSERVTSGAKDGWRRLFGGDDAEAQGGLFYALRAVHAYIELWETGGGAMRPLYADFIDEVASALDISALHEVSRQYHELAAQWTDLAAAALPDRIEPLGQARELAQRKWRAFRARGQSALDEMRLIQEGLDDLVDQVEADWPLTERETEALLEELRERIDAVRDAEEAAIRDLAEVMAVDVEEA